MFDEKKVVEGVKLILEGIGEDASREGLLDTPNRVAKMYKEVFGGMDEDAGVHLSRQFSSEFDSMIIEKDITFYSMCEHHLLPFFGKAHIAYIPGEDKKIVGLSKLARCVEVFARRPQVQEQLTEQIANAVMESLNPKGVMVMLEAEHTCMTMRGVKKPGSKTVTYALKGDFATDSNLQQQFFTAVK